MHIRASPGYGFRAFARNTVLRYSARSRLACAVRDDTITIDESPDEPPGFPFVPLEGFLPVA